jgi:hypothetical protein
MLLRLLEMMENSHRKVYTLFKFSRIASNIILRRHDGRVPHRSKFS